MYKNHVISIIMEIRQWAQSKQINSFYIDIKSSKLNFKVYVCFIKTKSIHTYSKHEMSSQYNTWHVKQVTLG